MAIQQQFNRSEVRILRKLQFLITVLILWRKIRTFFQCSLRLTDAAASRDCDITGNESITGAPTMLLKRLEDVY